LTVNLGFQTLVGEPVAMPLPTREELAKSFLDGTQRYYEARVIDLTSDIDNLLANSVGIDDHQFIDKALRDVVEKLANERDYLQTVSEYRKKRGL
jgi:hypothetical protein